MRQGAAVLLPATHQVGWKPGFRLAIKAANVALFHASQHVSEMVSFIASFITPQFTLGNPSFFF